MIDQQEFYTQQALKVVTLKEQQLIKQILTSKKRGAATKIDNLSLSGCIGNKFNTNSGSLSPILPFTSSDNYNLKLNGGLNGRTSNN